MSIEQDKLKNIIEAALLAVAKPMSVEQILKLFSDEERPSANAIKEMLRMLQNDCESRGIELKQVASGYRYQARSEYSEWLSRLWEEKPAKYSRAALETLALIAYRQPVTRAEIEDVRGVGVSSSIIKTMMEREWVRVVGHRDVPGRPALYATTKQFLDYFNMKSLQELPTLAEIKDLDELHPELDLPEPDQDPAKGQFDPESLKQDNSYPSQVATAENLDDSIQSDNANAEAENSNEGDRGEMISSDELNSDTNLNQTRDASESETASESESESESEEKDIESTESFEQHHQAVTDDPNTESHSESFYAQQSEIEPAQQQELKHQDSEQKNPID